MSALPSGWTMAVDPQTGRPYYHNAATGTTSWSLPEGSAGRGLGGAAPLPPGWEARLDPGSGREYYIDHARGVTQWTPPSSSGPPPPAGGAYSLPPSSSGYQLPAQQNGGRPSAELSAADIAAIAAIEEADAREEEERRRARDASAGGGSSAPGGAAGSADGDGLDGDGEPRAHEWVSNKDADSCFLTGVKFTLTNRRHHCRYCGQCFAAAVSSKKVAIPALGFREAVRVCDTCAAQLQAGDPLCASKEVSRMREKEAGSQAAGCRALAEWAAFDPQFAGAELIGGLQRLGAFERTAELLAPDRPAAVQAAAAKLLASMAYYEAYLKPLAALGAKLVAPTLGLLRSSKTPLETRTAAARALAMLLDEESLRVVAASEGAAGVLLEQLLEGECPDALLEWLAAGLARLCAADESAAREMARAGAAFVLAPSLGSGSPAVVEEVGALLAMLAAADSDARTQLCEAGALPHLVAMLRSRAPGTREGGFALAREVCKSPKAAAQLADAGGAPPLLNALQMSGAPAQAVSDALQLLLALAAAGGAALSRVQAAAREANATPTLTQLMQSQDASLRRLAMQAVSTLSAGDAHASDVLRESGGVVLLSEALLSPDEGAALQAVSTIAQMSASGAHVQAIVDNKCLGPLLQLLGHRSAPVRAEAEHAFSNLARSGAINAMLVQDPAACRHLLSLLRRSGGVMQAQAAIALAGIAADAPARETLYAQGALPQLVALLVADPELAGAAVQGVAHFAADERFRGSLAELGAAPGLCAQLGHRSADVSRCALSAVANLSFVPAAAPALAACGAPLRLAELLFSPDEGSLGMALAALCNLSAPDPTEAAQQLLQAGGALGLATLLTHASPRLQAQAALLVGQLSACAPFARAAAAADATQLLSALLHAPSAEVQANAVYALGILSGQDEAAAASVEASGAVTTLTRILLGGGPPDAKRRATLALANIVRGGWRSVYNAGGFAALLVALNAGTDAVQQEVGAAIAQLAADPTHRRALLSDVGAVSSIVAILASEQQATQACAAEAVLAFAEEPAAREALYAMGLVGQLIRLLTAPAGSAGAPSEEGRAALVGTLAHFAADGRYCDSLRIAMSPLCEALSLQHAPTARHAARALANLAQSEANVEALNAVGAVSRLAELLTSQDAPTQECAVLALAQLRPPASLAARFLGNGWQLALLALLEHPERDVQAAAASVLGDLCADGRFRETMLRDGALQTVAELLAAGQPQAALAALRALRAMAAPAGAQPGGAPSRRAEQSAVLQLAQAVCAAEPAAQLRAALCHRPAAPAPAVMSSASALRAPSALNPSAGVRGARGGGGGGADGAPARPLESLVSLAAAELVADLAGAAAAAAELLAEAGAATALCALLGALLDAPAPVDAELACAAARAVGSLSLCASGAAELRAARAPQLLARAVRAAGCAPLQAAAADALGLCLVGLGGEASAADVQLALAESARAACARPGAAAAAAGSAALCALSHVLGLRGAASLEPKVGAALVPAVLGALRCREPEWREAAAQHALACLQLLLASPTRAAALGGRAGEDVEERLAELSQAQGQHGGQHDALRLGARRALALLGASAVLPGGLGGGGAGATGNGCAPQPQPQPQPAQPAALGPQPYAAPTLAQQPAVQPSAPPPAELDLASQMVGWAPAAPPPQPASLVPQPAGGYAPQPLLQPQPVQAAPPPTVQPPPSLIDMLD